MKKFITITFGILYFTIHLSSQVNWGLEVSSNYPYIPNNDDIYDVSDYYISSEDFNEKIRWRANILAQIELRESINLEVGIGIKQYSFNRTITNKTRNPVQFISQPLYPTDEVIPATFYTYDTYTSSVIFSNDYINKRYVATNLYYFTLPVNLQYSLIAKRLMLGGGIEISALFKANREFIDKRPSALRNSNSIGGDSEMLYMWAPAEMTYISNPENYFDPNVYSYTGFTDDSFSDFNSFMLSGNISSQLRLINQLWLLVEYQHSFNRIYNHDETYKGDARYNTFSLGLKYYLDN